MDGESNHQIQNEFIESIKVVKIDVDKNPQKAKDFGIASLPSILIFQNKEVKEIASIEE